MGSWYSNDLTELYGIELTEKDIRIHRYINLMMLFWCFYVLFILFVNLLF